LKLRKEKMKRRDFIKVSSAAGIAGLVGPGYTSMAHSAPSETDGFDLHPFIK
jgi:anaerobic selenocysteine-containing dehydrogenase